jgi:hypothetical protein
MRFGPSKLTRGLTVAAMLLGGSAGVLMAQSSVLLAWNANTDSDTRGYYVHYGTVSLSYSNVVSVGSAPSVTLTNLTPGTTYYFAVSAYGSAGIEGPYSTEISYTVPLARPIPPSIAMTSPLNGAMYTAPANISMTANVTTNGHIISNVQFYNGKTLIGQDAAPPYSMVWSNVAAGSYSVSARVVYDGTSAVDSPSAGFTVAAAGSVFVNLQINSSRQAVLSGNGQANHTFDVQATSNLKTNWATIGHGTNTASGSFQFTDPNRATNKFRSYRLIVH